MAFNDFYLVVESGEISQIGTQSGTTGGGNTGTAGAVEQFQYYYHPDHLGSSAYITDTAGEVYQHLEYFPFGESFVEETNTNRTPYLFTGKELDSETASHRATVRRGNTFLRAWVTHDFAFCACVFIPPEG